jgi:hypothetical protein
MRPEPTGPTEPTGPPFATRPWGVPVHEVGEQKITRVYGCFMMFLDVYI